MKDTKYCHGADYNRFMKALDRAMDMRARIANEPTPPEQKRTALNYMRRAVKLAYDMGLESMSDVQTLQNHLRIAVPPYDNRKTYRQRRDMCQETDHASS